MAQPAAIPQSAQTPKPAVESGNTHLARGSLKKLACKCSPKNDVDFLIKEDRIVCSFCGREILCTLPVLGVYSATCSCCSSPSVKSTFILDSRGLYICTWCGRTR